MKTVKNIYVHLLMQFLRLIIEGLTLPIGIDIPCSVKSLEALAGLSPSITCDLLVLKITRYADDL